jgi:flavoprotein
LYSIRNIDKLKLLTLLEKVIQQLKLLNTEGEKVMKSYKLFEAIKKILILYLKRFINQLLQ